MSTIRIEEARREGAKIVLGLAGCSGGGKTFTALLLAYGLAKRDGKKVGFLDTENRRGRLYADILPGGAKFLIGDLVPPFSPQRHIEAIRAFEEAGVEVLVIDSISHEWEGVGGCEEIATDGNPKLPRWNRAKAEHKKFMNALLQSSMHIIVCLRAREKVKMSKDERGGTLVESLGIQPIQEKNFMFELTASLMMKDMGRRQDVLKCPEAIRHALGKGEGYLGIETGEALRAWIDGATPIDKDLERVRAQLSSVCEQGTVALQAAWTALPAKTKQALKDELPALKASAAGYDTHRQAATEANGADAAADVNAAIAGTPAPAPAPAPAAAPAPNPQPMKETPRVEKPAAPANGAPATNATTGPAPQPAAAKPAPAAVANGGTDDDVF
jgi:hypothetical protein